ncbi:response regulator transcription factor [Actinomadura sp. 9N407]|uniref:response regulator transcription factor n=1 Tax=Actinomadura sp. 9N407 TaxID=3375154 RepID=UPI00378B1CF3
MAVVLLVEDDDDVRHALLRELRDLGHTVRSVSRALEALREVAADAPDVVVLDLGLPDLDGGEALKMLRAVSDVPVIVATARDGEQEIIRLLRSGADDYLVKPFSAGHLHARVEAVLRRARTVPRQQLLMVGALHVDIERRQARLDGTPLHLSRKEFDMLAFLARNADRVVTRRELLAEVWQQPYGDDQTIDVHLSWLRRKLGDRAAAPRYLHTVRGVGVMLTAPKQPAEPE